MKFVSPKETLPVVRNKTDLTILPDSDLYPEPVSMKLIATIPPKVSGVESVDSEAPVGNNLDVFV